MEDIAVKCEFFLKDEAATVSWGMALGSAVKNGAVVYLSGTLGAGKTTLSRGVLNAFGYSGPVKSPTYTLVETYEMEDIAVHHFDLYRLGDPEELEFLGIRDYLSQAHVALIEWPQRGQGFIPAADIHLSLNPEQEGRKLVGESFTTRGAKILSSLRQLKWLEA